MNPSPIPYALIGCGTVAQYGHLPAIAKCANLKLVAISDSNPETAQAIADKYGAKPYLDYRDLLNDSEAVAVTVSTPLPFHYEVVAAALNAGKHSFCEKPFTDTAERGVELVELARQRDRLVAVNFEYRFEEAVRLIREILASGELGRLQVMRFINNWSAHGVRGAAGERRARFLQYGGGSMDCGVHFLDLARFISDSNFQDFSARGQWVEPEFAGPGHMLIQARMESGVLAHLESSFVYTHRSQTKAEIYEYDIIGERGVLSWRPGQNLDGSEGGNLSIFTEDRTETIYTNSAKQFDATYESWADAVRAGSLEGSGLASGEDGAQAARWMCESLEQAAADRAQFQLAGQAG